LADKCILFEKDSFPIGSIIFFFPKNRHNARQKVGNFTTWYDFKTGNNHLGLFFLSYSLRKQTSSNEIIGHSIKQECIISKTRILQKNLNLPSNATLKNMLLCTNFTNKLQLRIGRCLFFSLFLWVYFLILVFIFIYFFFHCFCFVLFLFFGCLLLLLFFWFFFVIDYLNPIPMCSGGKHSVCSNGSILLPPFPLCNTAWHSDLHFSTTWTTLFLLLFLK
jgi:hypothetical protein